MNKVCVLGSMNMDLLLSVKTLPKKGETLLVDTLKKNPGGKGANQAVAAKRLGSDVHMISKLGKDDNGEILLTVLKEENINIENVFIDSFSPSGIAIITVDSNGDNMISVVAGANMKLSIEDVIQASPLIKSCKVMVSQFETPYESTLQGFKIAKSSNVITILNPAPAHEITTELLSFTDIIVPNETETYELTGIEVTDDSSARCAGEYFISKGVKTVIITLGSRGAALITADSMKIIPAFKVNAVDATAAGDSFIGAIASRLHSSEDLQFDNLCEIITFANKVSSLTVTKKGAQISLPTIEDVLEAYKED